MGHPSLLKDSQFPVELCRTGDLFFCRMALGNTTYEFEWTEGVETQAVVCSQLMAVLLLCDLTNAFQESADRCPMSVYIEHIPVLWQILSSKGQNLFGKTAEVDTGSKTDKLPERAIVAFRL